MLDHHVGHAAVGHGCGKELPEGLNPPGRGSDPDHPKGKLGPGGKIGRRRNLRRLGTARRGLPVLAVFRLTHRVSLRRPRTAGVERPVMHAITATFDLSLSVRGKRHAGIQPRKAAAWLRLRGQAVAARSVAIHNQSAPATSPLVPAAVTSHPASRSRRGLQQGKHLADSQAVSCKAGGTAGAHANELRCATGDSLSGRTGTRRLQGGRPPEHIVNQRLGGRLELLQSSLDIAALVVGPQGGHRDVDG